MHVPFGLSPSNAKVTRSTRKHEPRVMCARCSISQKPRIESWSTCVIFLVLKTQSELQETTQESQLNLITKKVLSKGCGEAEIVVSLGSNWSVWVFESL